MTKQNKKLICIDTSPIQQAAYRAWAEGFGLEVLSCSTDSEWMEVLNQHEPLIMLIVGQSDNADEDCRTIEHFRLSPLHAGLPIALLLRMRDEETARLAMEAGATEIFLQSEEAALCEFMADCVASTHLPHFAGKALVVEDDEDHAAYVTALCQSMGFEVCRVDQVDPAITALETTAFQLVITDVILKGTKSGLSLVRHIGQAFGARLPVLVTSGFDDIPRRMMALKSGVGDFISKPIAAAEFIWRVQRIMRMAATVDSSKTALFTSDNAHTLRSHLFHLLSPREYEICIAMMEGKSDKSIAANLSISYWTVRSHVQQIFAKTGAINRRELMARYIASSQGSGT